MQEQHTSPLSWIEAVATGLQWPVILVAAFWLGRYVQKLEMRVVKAESRIESLVERHMPAIHRALAEIRGMLTGR
jgi:SMC interacting uncharacterized protein involved in chromosome segregation